MFSYKYSSPFWHQLRTVFDWLKELLNVDNYLGYYLAQY